MPRQERVLPTFRPVRDGMLVKTYATHTIPRPVRDGMLVEKFYAF
jgi:hypothetical protein